jgi:DNA-directed RNA polymerase subunit omega
MDMAITSPEIDTLLSKTDQNPFLLCSIAAKRACDINNMLRGQHLRVTAIQEVDDITTVVSGEDSVSIAMAEINDNVLSYVKDEFDEAIKGSNARVQRNS